MMKRQRSKKGNRDLMVRRHYAIPPVQVDAMQAASDRLGISESEILRQALAAWLASQAKAPTEAGRS